MGMARSRSGRRSGAMASADGGTSVRESVMEGLGKGVGRKARATRSIRPRRGERRPGNSPLPGRFLTLQRAPGQQERGRIPALARHAHGRQRAAVEPLGEAPVVERIGVGQLRQPGPAGAAQAQAGQRHHPEAADEGPDAAVVVLVHEVLAMPAHVGPPQVVLVGQRVQHHAHGQGAARMGGLDGVDDAVRHRLVGKAGLDGQQVAEHIALVAHHRQVHEAQEQARIAPAAPGIVLQQPGAVVLGQVALEGVEEVVEMVLRVLRLAEREAALDVEPQGIGVEHVARARHDVRPVAGLVLLQQPEMLVLLREQPADGTLDAVRPAAGAHRAVAAHVVHRDQPPERGIDAAQVPEIRIASFRIDVFGNLAVGGLLRGQGIEAGHGALLQGRHAAAAHRHDAHGRVAPEDPRVAPRHRRRGAARGQDAVGREVAFEQREGGFRTGIDQREGLGVEGMVCHGHAMGRRAGRRAPGVPCARWPRGAGRPGGHAPSRAWSIGAGTGSIVQPGAELSSPPRVRPARPGAPQQTPKVMPQPRR